MAGPGPQQRVRGGAAGRATRLVATLTGAILALGTVEALDLQLVGGVAFARLTERLLLLGAIVGALALASLPLLAVELGAAALAARSGHGARAGPAPWAGADGPLRLGAAVALLLFVALGWAKEYAFELHYIAYAYDRVDDVALLAATLNSALGLLVVSVALLGGALARAGGRRLEARHPGAAGRAAARVGAGALLGLAAAGYRLCTRERSLLPAGATVGGALALLALAQALCALATLRRAPHRSARRRVWPAAARYAACLLLAPLTLGAAGSAPREALLERAALAGAVTRAALAATDLDGDGASGLLGGGDCDGLDPAVFPAALDLPGDGIDQNCTGADAAPDAASPFVPLTPRPAATPGARVVWIVVDSLRADRTGPGGARRRLTPRLDAFAGGAATFTAARSQATRTRESFPSFLTGQLPSTLAVAPAAAALHPSLTRLLAARGYRTGLVTPVRNYPPGLAEEFEQLEASLSVRKSFIYGVSSPDVTRIAAGLLEAWRRERFFLLVHYFDPHGAYVPHRSFDFGDREVDRYDSEVAFTDDAVGALLELIERNGLLRDTIVVVSADHGEAFGEHGAVAHGAGLYEELVRVPLVIRAPGLPARLIRAPVALVDVVPTLLDLLGLPDPGRLQGRSLRPLLAGEPAGAPRPTPLGTSWPGGGRFLGVVQGRHKYVLELTTGTERLTDLVADPAERTNLIGARPAEARALRALVDAAREGQARVVPIGARAP